MDSDTSSVAAWSFSMATPTTAPLGGAEKAGGSCSHANLSLMSAATTAVDEDSIMMSEDEEGISSADESILKLLGNEKSDHYKTLLKIKDKVLIKNKVCKCLGVHYHWCMYMYVQYMSYNICSM